MSSFQKSFTLLELLVVITIIGILSSIVIVSMSGSTDSASIAKGKAYAQQVHALLGANAVGVWNFDEGIGTTLTDISGYGNNGTLGKGANGTGLDWVASDIGGTALQFDGVDDYVDCGNNPDVTSIIGDLTLEAWVKPGDCTDSGVISTHYGKNDFTRPYTLAVWSSNERPSIIFGTGTGWVLSTSPNSLTQNVWHHLVGTISGNDIKLYVDGILEAKNIFSGTRQTGSKLVLGSDASTFGTSRRFNGLIDEVRIYSEALTATEIQKHYVQGLEKMFASNAISEAEYAQRTEEFIRSMASE